MAFLYYPIFLTPAHPTNLQIVAEQSVSKLIGNIWMVDRNLCKEKGRDGPTANECHLFRALGAQGSTQPIRKGKESTLDLVMFCAEKAKIM
jgi:hypothetical protein